MRFRKTYHTDYVRHALCRFFADPEKLDFGSRCDELNYFACRFAVLELTAAERRFTSDMPKPTIICAASAEDLKRRSQGCVN